MRRPSYEKFKLLDDQGIVRLLYEKGAGKD